MTNRIVGILVIGHCLICAEVALAQTAQVRGKIVNRSDKGIDGASVKLVSSVDDQIGRRAEVRYSDADGNFRLPFDWSEIANATQRGAVWEVQAEKADYNPARANVLLVSGKLPKEVRIEMSPKTDRDKLMSRVDGCANPGSDARTVYVFDFANDSSTPQKLHAFQQLLGFKLQNGVRTKLEGDGLLADFPFEIKTCSEAPVKDESDALFAGKRLGCPGVISGFIEEQTNQLKSVVCFTALGDPPLTDFAPVVFSSDLSLLIQPDQQVNNAYVAFSSFVLGQMYLRAGRTNLAVKCFVYTKTINPSSMIAMQADSLAKALEQTNPARNLVPVGGPIP